MWRKWTNCCCSDFYSTKIQLFLFSWVASLFMICKKQYVGVGNSFWASEGEKVCVSQLWRPEIWLTGVFLKGLTDTQQAKIQNVCFWIETQNKTRDLLFLTMRIRMDLLRLWPLMRDSLVEGGQNNRNTCQPKHNRLRFVLLLLGFHHIVTCLIVIIVLMILVWLYSKIMWFFSWCAPETYCPGRCVGP